ncbi:hypothetical protein [Helicobacter bizzozeronii]|uniref:hypothetical protein n=1 Tax=Helicobacter bizzozeronii TaxID=56877 RepID=UPI000CF0F7BD|nr:hypothetical protein [Helicobacter bizzozeronii]
MKKPKSLSLALALAFGGLPSLDALDVGGFATDSSSTGTTMTVNQLVDSISGMLGGGYSIAGDVAPGIMGTSGSAPYVGVSSNATGNATVNNPNTTYQLYGNGVENGGTSGTLYNLIYGNVSTQTQGLTSQSLGSLGGSTGATYNNQTNIYSTTTWDSTLQSALQAAQQMAENYYNYRTAFSGTTQLGNAITQGAKAATASPYWSVTASGGGALTMGSNGQAAVVGNFPASGGVTDSLDTGKLTVTNANNLLGTIYNNIAALADNKNLQDEVTGTLSSTNNYATTLSNLLGTAAATQTQANAIYNEGLALQQAAVIAGGG